ncbi:hypothetical protein [Sulfitobacter sp. R18_1]|uniref:hypothetical protein n=1 Tax=Sulfitobacter sp. R18_1 TaxID=2821104 RepID=UPI001ADB5CD5|nr:hypothetical protein [Sulfitobacter sp. R18_1]MBO9428493.1 hypothetical protein [Sulfitobacter sp. R18_1]
MSTHKTQIIDSFLAGEFKPAKNFENSHAARALHTLLPVQTVAIVSPDSLPMSALSDRYELDEALSLGDIIYEEVGVDVPMGSLVVMQRESLYQDNEAGDSSYRVGLIIGEALIHTITSGIFTIETENEALYIMAASYARNVTESLLLQDMGICPKSFKLGLAKVLGEFWVGSSQAFVGDASVFLRDDFLECRELRKVIGLIDPSFSAPAYSDVPRKMTMVSDALRSFETWMTIMRSVVMEEIKKTKTVTPVNMKDLDFLSGAIR